MNWLDWLLLVLIGLAAFKGFSRGFIIELASLVALVAGIWAGVHFSDKVTGMLGLEVQNSALAFLVTFVVVLLAVHLLARFMTTLIDMAQLSLPNKLAGVLFGALRSVFTLSILLNILAGYGKGELPPKPVVDGSALYGPMLATAPMIVPALGSTKWISNALDAVREAGEEIL